MSSLPALAIAAIAQLAPAGSADPDELGELASAIAKAVESSAFDLPFQGSARQEATVLALVAIAFQESGFRADVLHCEANGDSGRSITAFQLMRGWSWQAHTKDELCTSHELAATLALRVLGMHSRQCKTAKPLGWFYGYGSGSCGKPHEAGVRQCATWERLAADYGLDGAACNRRQPITFAKTTKH